MAYDNPLALNLLKGFEGYTAKPKWDHKQYSVGYSTRWTPGTPWGTRADHEAALAREAGNVDGWLGANVKAPLTPGQRAALTSFGYNLGEGAIGKLLPDINAGNWDRVGQRMMTFTRAGDNPNALVDRRRREVEILRGGGDIPAAATPGQHMAANAAREVNEGGPMPSPIGGAPIAGGPVPLTAPNMRYSKLADALLASAAGAKPKGWGDLLNAGGDLALGYSLANRADEEQKGYKSQLAERLLASTDADGMAKTLMATGDDDLVKQGVALKVAQSKPQNQVGRFRPSKQGVVDTVTGQIVPGTEASGEADAEYGTSPQYYRDKDGKLRIGQLSKAGGMKAVDLPEGGEAVLPGVDKVDTGTEFVFRDKRTNEVVGVQPKNITGKEAAEERGKSAGQAQVALPAAATMVDNAVKTIADLRKHPGLEVGTGASNVFNPESWIPGTPSYDFQAKNKQAQGQSFMAARDALKGAGQVTDFEGAKGEQAIANLDAAQSKEQYLSALDNVERMLRASYDDLQRKAGMANQPTPVHTQTIDPLTGQPAAAGPARVQSQQEYQALPPGTQYVAPDGSIRVKK